MKRKRMGRLLSLLLPVMVLLACAKSGGQTAGENSAPAMSDSAIYRIANVATGNYLECNPGGENVISDSVPLRTATQNNRIEQRFSLLSQENGMYLLLARNEENGVLVNVADAGNGNIRILLNEKEGARGFFNRMRQKFIDWNYTEFESDAFKKTESEIDALYKEGGGKLGEKAAFLLKDGEQE